ncbi:hypothetical protein VTL71DRAFT_9772 [Oculimacula yallundae]|uniref:Uncharacterized protein n=1 Tax=Oculimacula yallundae TaxID=86028 RepID=A0ABR4BSN1_9HELO
MAASALYQGAYTFMVVSSDKNQKSLLNYLRQLDQGLNELQKIKGPGSVKDSVAAPLMAMRTEIVKALTAEKTTTDKCIRSLQGIPNPMMILDALPNSVIRPTHRALITLYSDVAATIRVTQPKLELVQNRHSWSSKIDTSSNDYYNSISTAGLLFKALDPRDEEILPRESSSIRGPNFKDSFDTRLSLRGPIFQQSTPITPTRASIPVTPTGASHQIWPGSSSSAQPDSSTHSHLALRNNLRSGSPIPTKKNTTPNKETGNVKLDTTITTRSKSGTIAPPPAQPVFTSRRRRNYVPLRPGEVRKPRPKAGSKPKRKGKANPKAKGKGKAKLEPSGDKEESTVFHHLYQRIPSKETKPNITNEEEDGVKRLVGNGAHLDNGVKRLIGDDEEMKLEHQQEIGHAKKNNIEQRYDHYKGNDLFFEAIDEDQYGNPIIAGEDDNLE